MNLREIGRKYDLVVLEEETIEDLEKDVEQNKKVLKTWLDELERLSKLIITYKKGVEITKAYIERLDKTVKVIEEARKR